MIQSSSSSLPSLPEDIWERIFATKNSSGDHLLEVEDLLNIRLVSKKVALVVTLPLLKRVENGMSMELVYNLCQATYSKDKHLDLKLNDSWISFYRKLGKIEKNNALNWHENFEGGPLKEKIQKIINQTIEAVCLTEAEAERLKSLSNLRTLNFYSERQRFLKLENLPKNLKNLCLVLPHLKHLNLTETIPDWESLELKSLEICAKNLKDLTGLNNFETLENLTLGLQQFQSTNPKELSNELISLLSPESESRIKKIRLSALRLEKLPNLTLNTSIERVELLAHLPNNKQLVSNLSQSAFKLDEIILSYGDIDLFQFKEIALAALKRKIKKLTFSSNSLVNVQTAAEAIFNGLPATISRPEYFSMRYDHKKNDLKPPSEIAMYTLVKKKTTDSLIVLDYALKKSKEPILRKSYWYCPIL